MEGTSVRSGVVCAMALRVVVAIALTTLTLVGIGCSGGGGAALPAIVVNSTADDAAPAEGVVTLRSALAAAASGQTITFDEALDGATITLSVVGCRHTTLPGEVMGMRDEPSGPVSYLVGYFERDYGRSALYARKNVVIDASALARGVTVAWDGGGADDARVLAVWGALVMRRVTVTGGRSVTEALPVVEPDDQPWTLARGGGLAVFGRARLEDCTIHGCGCVGDFESSRDRGAFGGGIYANEVDLVRCVVAGNDVVGAGAAGGGVYAVCGYGVANGVSRLERCAVTGNRIAGLLAYGGGVYSDGGGIGTSNTLSLRTCTVAGNVVEPVPGLPSFLLAMGYWRGGGLYLSNGNVEVIGCTVVLNEVYGLPRTDALGKRNLAGGMAATIGNAHAVDDWIVGSTIATGNRVFELDGDGDVAASYDHDVFTGSAFAFFSNGWNRFGVVDFSQMLAPVGQVGWYSLCRRHYPKTGDEDGVAVGDVLDLVGGCTRSTVAQSVGVDALTPAVVWWTPQGSALDVVPEGAHAVAHRLAEYRLSGGAGDDDFLAALLGRLETLYGLAGFATAFRADFETFLQTVDTDDETEGLQPYTTPEGVPILTLADTAWFGPANTWPKEVPNYPYIEFWHRLDAALAARDIPGMGGEILGDGAWGALFTSGPLAEHGGVTMSTWTQSRWVTPSSSVDQVGTERPRHGPSDVGSVEVF